MEKRYLVSEDEIESYSDACVFWMIQNTNQVDGGKHWITGLTLGTYNSSHWYIMIKMTGQYEK